MAARKPISHAKDRLKLNLLYPQGEKLQFSARFLQWLLSYGRLILIAVELLVLGAFAMRFSLDYELANLRSDIEDQIPFIESMSQQTTEIRQMQYKLEVIKKNLDFNPKYTIALDEVAKNTPQNIRLDSLTLENTPLNVQMRINGKSPTYTDLSLLMKHLQENDNFTEVTLANIGIEEGLTTFNITGKLK